MSARTDRGKDSRGFTHFARDLRDFWWLLLVTAALLGYIGFAVSSTLEPRYSAVAKITYAQRDADAVTKALTDAGTAGLPKTLSSDVLILQTSAFAERVTQALWGAVSPEAIRDSLTVSVTEDVELVEIKASSPQAELAANIANASAEEFIGVRQEELQVSLRSALEFVQGRIDSLTAAERSGSIGSDLERQKYALGTLLASSIADYKVLEKATTPTDPYFPDPVVSVLLGVAVGLVLGSFLVWFAGSIDRHIKDRAALAHALDLPVIGTLPAISGKQGGKRSSVGFTRGSEHLLEPTKMLRSSLKVLGFGDNKRTLLISSAASKDGKSSLAIDLTLAMTLAGDRVILVDADLRDPSIHVHLGLPNTHGLGDMLSTGALGWSDKVHAVDLAPYVEERLLDARKAEGRDLGVTKFLCLTSGTLPTDLTEVLKTGVLADLLAELQGYSDYVIIDGPPMSATSDALTLARSVDAVILTSTLGKQTAAETRQVRQLLTRAEVEPLGVVLFGDRQQTQGLHKG